MKPTRDGAVPDVDFLSTHRSPEGAPLAKAQRTQDAVIVGYQQSHASARALVWAADEASSLSVPLFVARAWRWDEDFAETPLAPSQATLIDTAQTTLPDIDPVTVAGLRLVLCDGEPAGDLERLAAYGQMMVVGRRRIPLTQRLFNGSVSRHLVAAADRPVVVVPDSHAPIKELGPIVVGVSESRAASAAVEWASRRAVRRNEELLLINVYPAEAVIRTDVGTDETVSGRGSFAASALLLDRAAALARETAGPSLLIRRQSVPGTAERALLEACAHGALLVLGRHRRSWPGHRVGYIADFVLRHAELPIAVIPDQARPESPR